MVLRGRTFAEVKTDLSLDSVENTALSTWAGTANIITVGTIGTGTWQGDAIADGYISSAATWNAKQDALTFGIADTNAVQINSATVVDDDYAKFTATGLEGRSAAEVKTDLSLNSVENTALSTWAGTANITTLGTIGAGTWNADTIGVTKGGTGKTSITLNSYLKGGSGNTYVERTYAEVKTDLSLDSVENTALSTWAGTGNYNDCRDNWKRDLAG